VITSTGQLEPELTWNLVTDIRQLFTYPFMVNALQAGTIVAVLGGVIGWFTVLRRQAFTAHTVAVVGFPGAAGAILLGVSATAGFFAFAIAAAIIIALIPSSGRVGYATESALTGTVQATALALGFVFSSLYGGFTSGASALLFGSFLGITAEQVRVLLGVAVAALAVLAVLGRRLLFATVDPTVAAARGVGVRATSLVFLLLLAVTAAEVAQITGTLLIFALLIVPAAVAQALTARPVLGLVLAVGVGLLVSWISLFVAYYEPYPIGFILTSLAFAAYVVTALPQRKAGTATLRRLVGTRRTEPASDIGG
jgi:zinc/manganese transport system permease protein